MHGESWNLHGYPTHMILISDICQSLLLCDNTGALQTTTRGALVIPRRFSPEPLPAAVACWVMALSTHSTRCERMRGSMYDMDRLLKALTLSVVVLGSVRPSSAFFLPPSGGRHLRRSPPAAVARRQHDQQQCILRQRHRRQRTQQDSRQSRSVRSRPHFSSSAAPADAARDEEPWKDDLGAAAEAPFFPPASYGGQQQQQQYPTATSPAAATRVVGESRDAFTFAPKPLREGRVLRAMKRTDVDAVVNL